jgi:hypothetical protein
LVNPLASRAVQDRGMTHSNTQQMHPAVVQLDAPMDQEAADRRRPGRQAVVSQHLIAVLRTQAVGTQRPWPFAFVLLAAVGFWALAVAAVTQL